MVEFVTHPWINNWPVAILLNFLIIGLCFLFYWAGITGKYDRLFKKKKKPGINSGAKFG